MTWTLVTGGSKGLGEAICYELGRRGHSVLVHYNKSAQEAGRVMEKCRSFGVNAECIQGDFSSVESTFQFISSCKNQFPIIGNLVNNVGSYLIASALHTTVQDWTQLFQVNLHAPFMIIQEMAETIKNEQGAIVNIGTAGLGMKANVTCTGYVLTKLSLLALTRSFARELAPWHVRVNMVSPGQLENSVDNLNPLQIPMGRLGNLSEVAQTVAYLLSPEATYVTGQNLEVAGGYAL